MKNLLLIIVTAGSLVGCVAPSVLPPHAHSTPAQSHLVDGIWKGTYVCQQGVTNLTLSLQTGLYGDVFGVFSFSANASNRAVPSGQFRVSGRLQGNRLFLKAGDWISQPPGYTPLDVDGIIDLVEKSYTGTLCGYPFGLRKI